MRYRGFDLKPVEKRFPHAILVRGIGIFRGGECLTYAADPELAKRLVDRIAGNGWQIPRGIVPAEYVPEVV